MRVQIVFALLTLPAVAWVGTRAPRLAPLSSERALATLVPADSTVYLEAPGLADLAARGIEHPLVAATLAEPRLKALLAARKVDPRRLLDGLDALAGFEVLPTIARLSQDGAALALAFRRAKPSALLVLRGADARAFGEEIEDLLALAAERAGHPGAFDQPMDHVLGADLWRAGDDLTIARRETLALVSNDESYLRDALELAAEAEARGLAGAAGFAEVPSARPAGELLFAFADVRAVDARAEQGLLDDADGWRKLRGMAREPAAQLLLGASFAALGSARSVSLSVVCEREDLRLVLTGHGVDCGPASALLPQREERFAPAPNGRPNAASWVLYRDLADLFGRRTELFPADRLPAFAEALSNLAIFFGGSDVTETVVPALAPWARVIARDVTFDPGLEPEIPLPAAALIARVADTERVAPLFPSAFQTVVGLMNVERGQRGKPPMQLQLELVGEAQVTFARLLPPGPDEGVDVAYNLEPACALVGDLLVLGTHRKLVEGLVRELAAGQVDARAPTSERLELSGDALLAALLANREALVMNSVLREGRPRTEAEGEVDGLLAVASLVDRVSLEARRVDEQRFALELALDLAAPKE